MKDGYDVTVCAACSLVFVANPPTDDERADLYSFSAGYHQGLAADPKRIAWHDAEARANLKLLRRHVRAGRLLDIGCSTGLFLKAARESGWTGRGLEYSADSAAVARQQHGLEVDGGELTADRYADGAFDVVTMWDVLEHVPDPAAIVRRLARVVAPDGWLVLKTPNVAGLYPQASLRLAPRLDFWGHPEPPGHLYQFSAAVLGRMVRAHGFEVVATHQQRIPLGYSFGSLRQWFRSAKWLGYCLCFAPLALAGPWLGRGDDMVIVARRRVAGGAGA